MKRRYIYLITLFALAFTACLDDKGNYDYIPASEVINAEVSNLEASYQLALGERLVITPEITGLDENKTYRYEWYMITNVTLLGKAREKVALSEERNLDVILSGIDPTTYTLYFKIIDVDTEVYVLNQTPLSLSSSVINSGYYILKQYEGMTDIDYVQKTTYDFYADILRDYSNGDNRLTGNPVGIAAQKGNYYHDFVDDEEVVTNQSGLSAIHIVSTEGFNTIQFSTNILLKTLEEQFYGEVDVWAPDNILLADGGVFLINNGQIHTLSTTIKGAGKFGAAKSGATSLNASVIINASNTSVVYDHDTRTFARFLPTDYKFTTFDDIKDGNGYLASNFDQYELVEMPMTYGSFSPTTSNHVVVMRSLSDSKLYTVNFIIASVRVNKVYTTTITIDSFKEVAADNPLNDAIAYAAQRNMVPFYFATANALYSYNHEYSTVEEWASFPADETVTAMSINTSSAVKGLLVNTYNESLNQWKLYIYTYPTANVVDLNTEPLHVASGSGKAVQTIYVP